MKKLLSLLLIFIPLSGESVMPLKTNFDGCTPARTVMFAYTKDHRKAVEFCVLPHVYRFSYGPINQPEITLTAPPGESGLVVDANQMGVIYTGFAIKKGNDIYRTRIGPKGNNARLMIGQRVDGMMYDVALIHLEETGWGFIDNTAEPDAWPDFID